MFQIHLSSWLAGEFLIFDVLLRKSQREFREIIGLAPHVNPAAVLFHDTVANAQSQPHAFADVFGRKKRVKYFVKIVSRDSLAIVADDDEAFTVVVEAPYQNGRIADRI